MALLRQVKDVDGGFAFCVYQGHFDVAVVIVEDQGDLAEEAWGVLGYDLE